MRILFSILLSFISFMLLFSACNKEEEPTNPTRHGKINPDLHSFLFDTGSYWIYKDSNTASIDSTIVTSLTKDTFMLLPSTPGQGSPGDEEYFKITYSSYPSNSSFTEEILGSVITRGHTQGGVTYISSKSIGEAMYNAQIEDVMDSLHVEGHTYHQVVKMRIQADNYISANYTFYYVDSIGIIKKEKRVGAAVTETWNLLRYYVVIKPY